MDLNDLFQSCKKGDLNRVKYELLSTDCHNKVITYLFAIRELVEQKEVELNVRDKWDSTPLYYACLCGHTNLVRYLLKSGKSGLTKQMS